MSRGGSLRAGVAAVAVAIGLLVSGCGDDEEDSSSEDSGSSSSSTTTTQGAGSSY